MSDVGEVKELEFDGSFTPEGEVDPLELNEEEAEELKKLEAELDSTPEEETAEAEDEVMPDKKADTRTKAEKSLQYKFEQERKKRQDAERKLRDSSAEKDRAKQFAALVEKGYSEEDAWQIAESKADAEREREESRSMRMDTEIERLVNEPFFADAETYADELKEVMRENKKISVRQAYMMVRGEARTREYQLEQEQKNLNNRRKTEGKKVVSSSPSSVTSPYKLDEDDKKALARLRKADPEGDWTPKKYTEIMKT